MIPEAQEESGFRGIVLSCVCSVFSCFHAHDGAPPRLLRENFWFLEHKKNVASEVLCCLCSVGLHVYDGAPP